jgi:alanine racemase
MSINEATVSAAIDRAAAVLTVDVGAVVRNWQALGARLRPGAVCAAVVKADAYGLGAAAVAPALAAAGCRRFAVAQLDEAIALRPLLPAAEIWVLGGLLPGTLPEFAAHRLTPVLNDLGQLEAWRVGGDGAPAVLHVDTGMARLGLSPKELETLAEERRRLDGVRLAAVMSHLACADEEHALNPLQLERFRRALVLLPAAPASFANSAGIFCGPDYHFDIARPGIALYGGNPYPGRPNPMAQVVRLQGKILQVREIDRGETVGYGATHTATRPTRIATVGVGYADGWLRALGNRSGAVVAGRQVPLVGRVSMDLITLDITGIDPALARPGSFVDLLGDGRSVDDVAGEAGTISYEILTALGRRYHRVHLAAAAPA